MAIVRMKKVFLVGPEAVKQKAVEICQSTGVLHIKDLSTQPKDPPQELALELSRAKRILEHIRKLAKNGGIVTGDKNDRTIKDLLEEYDRLTASKSSLEQEISGLEKEHRILAPWGHFNPSDVKALSEHGVFFIFAQTTAKELKSVDQQIFKDAIINRRVELKGAKNLGLILAYQGNLPAIPFEQVSLPSRSLNEVERLLSEKRAALADLNREFTKLSLYADLFEGNLHKAQNNYDRAKVVAGVLEDGPIFAFGGFTPSTQVETLRSVFKNNGVVVIDEDPLPDDDVPIKLKNWPVIRNFEPLISMFKLPTYNEPDPTILVAPFMAVFFGFCFGDAVYGLLLFAIAWLLGRKLKDNEGAQGFLNLLKILGISTFIIGAFMGAFFGFSLAKASFIPEAVKKIFFLSSLQAEPMNYFHFAIKLGIIQLAIAFLIKISICLNTKQYQILLANIGLLLVAPIIYLTIYEKVPFTSLPMLILSGVAASLILIFSSPSPSVGKRIGGGLWAAYGLSGLLGDGISYARIFGLGLSSGIIAAVVNDLSGDLTKTIPVLGYVFAFILMVVGHTFNFAMSVIGSLVHSARLNFLEYYGKFFDGGGKPYAPFNYKEK
ncbi:hypothetical protein KKF34_10720 [Myxococcota bacterium]|nr:hypothetical protein [Myxococcota bacterium]MBU1380190.1 hypothetical protein [Myxococcota bacterium]MBU1497340.1 hypothetical protein [Myxococcota bacterium]